MSTVESTIKLLSQHLGLPVRLLAEPNVAVESVVGNASEPSMAASKEERATFREIDGVQTEVSVVVPGGHRVAWCVDRGAAPATLRHAETILLLDESNRTRRQLSSEAEALTAQVLNDFEELSLLRSLAAMVELTDSEVAVAEMTRKCLRPLSRGIGATSIAAIYIADDGEIQPAIWSDTKLADDSAIRRMIDDHREEATRHPVVRNESAIESWAETAPAIREFLLLQCRSEGRLHGWLLACNRIEDRNQVAWEQHGFTTVQASLLDTAAHQLAAQVHNLGLIRQKEALYTDVVRALVNAIEARDPYTSGHSERVGRLAQCLGNAIGETRVGSDRLYLTGLLHDVGKIAVPDGVLRKPGDLDANERSIIETHAEAGWQILHELEPLRHVLPGVLHHHERFDGKGYPDGLKGKDIPRDGRVLAVCDAFDAMTSDRPYREGMEIEKATEILQKGAGQYWDPDLVEVFIEHLDEFDRIRRDHHPRPRPVRRRDTVKVQSTWQQQLNSAIG